MAELGGFGVQPDVFDAMLETDAIGLLNAHRRRQALQQEQE